MKNATIQLSNLTTGYRHHPVTEHINATLNAGELTCLLGPNGAGKSTLLKTLCAFIAPLKGEILIDDLPLSRFSAVQLAKTIGVVLTERPKGVNMRVEELVAIGRSPYTSYFGSLSNKDKEIVEQSMNRVNISTLSERNINTLSDGEMQKALIAKALAQQTQIIILDEPTAFLDYPSKVEILKLLYQIAKTEGKTIFLSTHDIELAMQIADKIWLMDRELGLKIGSPEELAHNGSFAKYFERPGLIFQATTNKFLIQK